MKEAAESGDTISTIPPELEAENQRELIHRLKAAGNTQDPGVQELLQPWISALDEAKVSDVEGAFAQAQLYERAGLVQEALDQLDAIFARMDQTAPENRTAQDKAIANLAIDMEERLLRE